MADEEDEDEQVETPSLAPARDEWADFPTVAPARAAPAKDEWADFPTVARAPARDEWAEFPTVRKTEAAEPEAEAPGAVGSTVRGFLHGLLPTAGAVAAGARIGAPIGAAVGSIVPVIGTSAGAFGGAIIGGAAAGLGLGTAQEEIIKRVAPEEAEAYARAREEHPYLTLGGELAAGAPYAGVRAAGTLGQQLLQRGVMGGAGAGIDAAQQLALEHKFDPLRALEAGAGQAVLAGRPTALGRRLGLPDLAAAPARAAEQQPWAKPSVREQLALPAPERAEARPQYPIAMGDQPVAPPAAGATLNAGKIRQHAEMIREQGGTVEDNPYPLGPSDQPSRAYQIWDDAFKGTGAAEDRAHGPAGPKAQAPSEPVPPLSAESATQEAQNQAVRSERQYGKRAEELPGEEAPRRPGVNRVEYTDPDLDFAIAQKQAEVAGGAAAERGIPPTEPARPVPPAGEGAARAAEPAARPPEQPAAARAVEPDLIQGVIERARAREAAERAGTEPVPEQRAAMERPAEELPPGVARSPGLRQAMARKGRGFRVGKEGVPEAIVEAAGERAGIRPEPEPAAVPRRGSIDDQLQGHGFAPEDIARLSRQDKARVLLAGPNRQAVFAEALSRSPEAPAPAGAPPRQPPGVPGQPYRSRPDIPPLSKKDAAAKATTVDDLIDHLRRQKDADLPDVMNKIRASQKEAGMPIISRVRETAANFMRFLRPRNEASEQRMSRAVEDNDLSTLSPQERKYVEAVKRRLDPQIQADRQWFVDNKLQDVMPEAPGFIRRLPKGFQGDASEMVGEDPFGGTAVRGGKPSTLQKQVYQGMTAADGEHRVISMADDGSNILVGRGAGKVAHTLKNPYTETSLDQLYGKKLTYNGKEYTIGRTRMRDITEQVGQQYHESFSASKASEYMQLREARRNAEVLKRIRSDDPFFDPIRSSTPKTTPEGKPFERVDAPGLSHLYFDPQTAQALNRAYKADPYGNTWLAKANDILISSIFLNPVPHSLNEVYHHIIGRGKDWALPQGYADLFKTGARAITAVLSKNQDYVDALATMRAPMVNASRNSRDAMFQIANLVGADIKKAPHEWDVIAKTLGDKVSISDVLRSLFNASSSAMWNMGDILRLQRMYELQGQFERRGFTTEAARDKALTEMVRHQPDYRMPLTVLGSDKLADFMAGMHGGRYVSMFNRYHRLVFGSLADMVKNSVNWKNQEEMLNAWGHLAMTGIAAYVIYPQLSKIAQWVTGNKDAEVRPRGPVGVIAPAYSMVTGKSLATGRPETTDLSQVMNRAFTMAPTARGLVDTLTNKDWRGKTIVNPTASFPKQLLEAAEHAASFISPYGTYVRGTQPGGTKDLPTEIRNQLLDIKAPTPQQLKGKAFGEKQLKGEDKKREKKPQGPIEYYGRQGLKALGFKQGGPVRPPRERFLQRRDSHAARQ
jgi:hypothetical protein